MTSASSSPRRRWPPPRLAAAALGAILLGGVLAWSCRGQLLHWALDRFLAATALRISAADGFRIGFDQAALDRLELDFAARAGHLTLSAEQVTARYQAAAAALKELHARSGRLRFTFAAATAADGAGPGLPPPPFDRLRVESFQLELVTPWGLCRFLGRGELERTDEGGAEIRLTDDRQALRARFDPGMRLALLAVAGRDGAEVGAVRFEPVAANQRRVTLRAELQRLLEWFSATEALPQSWRDAVAGSVLPRLGGGLAGLRLEIAAHSADDFRSLSGSASVAQEGRPWLQARLARNGDGSATGEGRLELVPGELLSLLRPLLPEAVVPWQVEGGSLQGDVALRLDPAGSPTAAAHLSADFALQAGAVRLEAVHAVADSEDLFAAAATLTVAARQLRFGSAAGARNLAVAAALRGHQLAVQQAELEIFGGRLSLEPSTLDLDRPPVTLTIQVHDIDLAPLLAPFAERGLAGSGRVDGKLPLRLTADSVELEDGRLTGRGPGRLRYDGPSVDSGLAFRALRNFAYRRLLARLDYRPAGDYRLGLRLEGSNPDVLAGHAIAFNLRLQGQLPELLQQGILAGNFERPVLEQYEQARDRPPSQNEHQTNAPPPAHRRKK